MAGLSTTALTWLAELEIRIAFLIGHPVLAQKNFMVLIN
jgi:hypothetical protein